MKYVRYCFPNCKGGIQQLVILQQNRDLSIFELAIWYSIFATDTCHADRNLLVHASAGPLCCKWACRCDARALPCSSASLHCLPQGWSCTGLPCGQVSFIISVLVVYSFSCLLILYLIYLLIGWWLVALIKSANIFSIEVEEFSKVMQLQKGAIGGDPSIVQQIWLPSRCDLHFSLPSEVLSHHSTGQDATSHLQTHPSAVCDSCRASFHLPCAIAQDGCRFDQGSFVMLCPEHSSLKCMPCDSALRPTPKAPKR